MHIYIYNLSTILKRYIKFLLKLLSIKCFYLAPFCPSFLISSSHNTQNQFQRSFFLVWHLALQFQRDPFTYSQVIVQASGILDFKIFARNSIPVTCLKKKILVQCAHFTNEKSSISFQFYQIFPNSL